LRVLEKAGEIRENTKKMRMNCFTNPLGNDFGMYLKKLYVTA
jgi:hypothetical protein